MNLLARLFQPKQNTDEESAPSSTGPHELEIALRRARWIGKEDFVSALYAKLRALKPVPYEQIWEAACDANQAPLKCFRDYHPYDPYPMTIGKYFSIDDLLYQLVRSLPADQMDTIAEKVQVSKNPIEHVRLVYESQPSGARQTRRVTWDIARADRRAYYVYFFQDIAKGW